MYSIVKILLSVVLVAVAANGHLAAWHKGMFCLNGSTGSVDLNTASPVTPLYRMPKNDWWFHHINQCDDFPPDEGDFLELPAGGDFTVEIASNRAKTSLAYNGQYASDWPDGETYPEDYNVPTCITSPNMHTQNQSMAAGTAFAISYQSDIGAVTADNLVVFSVRYHTPWKRVTSYSVPAALPACPPEGCICAWGWVPNGCGEPNMYHQSFKCKVTGATGTAPVATPKPPVWCEDDPSKCVKGAKQMIYWNQNDGNNIKVSGLDLSGSPKSPAYNDKCGFPDGAQNDIFSGSSGGAPDAGSESPTNNGSSSSGSSGSGSGSSSTSPAASAPASSAPASSIPAPSTPSSSAPAPTPSSTDEPSNSTVLTTSSDNSPSEGGTCKSKRNKRRLAKRSAPLPYRHRPHHRRSNAAW